MPWLKKGKDKQTCKQSFKWGIKKKHRMRAVLHIQAQIFISLTKLMIYIFRKHE